jgi:hypothetical protein
LLLNTEDKLQRLVESGIDELTFSVDGAKQETYVRYRRGGDFNKVVQIMKRLAEIKREKKSDTPFINWRYILFRWNDSDEEMNLARGMADEMGIDRLCWEITDHPENSASERFVPGRQEYDKIHHEIWSALGNAIPNRIPRANIIPRRNGWKVKAGTAFQAGAEVQNASGISWPNTSKSNRRHVTFGVQLLDEQKRMLNRDFVRVLLPKRVNAGEKLELDFQAQAPGQPGEYWLKFDMVCEGIEWFESGGNTPVFQKLQVH